MTGFNHGMTGAVIALTVKNPLLAVPLAFISHFIQDAVPHHDYFANGGKDLFSRKFNVTLALDFAFSVCLMIVLALLFPTQKWLIWACMIAAASPDLMWGYYLLYRQKIEGRRVHYGWLARLHTAVENEYSGLIGLTCEAAWFVSMWVIVLELR